MIELQRATIRAMVRFSFFNIHLGINCTRLHATHAVCVHMPRIGGERPTHDWLKP